jgi:hypothetical protein
VIIPPEPSCVFSTLHSTPKKYSTKELYKQSMFSKRTALIYYREVHRWSEFVQDPIYTLSKPGMDFLVVVSVIFLAEAFVYLKCAARICH